MSAAYRKARYRCFACGFEERKWQLIFNNEILVEFKKLADEIKIYESWNELVSAERPK